MDALFVKGYVLCASDEASAAMPAQQTITQIAMEQCKEPLRPDARRYGAPRECSASEGVLVIGRAERPGKRSGGWAGGASSGDA